MIRNNVTQPGLYPDIAEDAYHADPCPEYSLSSSVARILLGRSPLHAWTAHPRLNPDYEPKEEKHLDFGSAAHRILTGRGRELEVLDFADYRTKAAKEARDAARAAGKTPILVEDQQLANEMVEAAYEQIQCIKGCEKAFRLGTPEPTIIAQVEEDTWLRCRPDWIEHGAEMVVDDYKTTSRSVHPMGWGRYAADLGYDFQAAFYERVITLSNPVNPTYRIRFRFFAQEKQPPYALSVMEFDEETLQSARRDVDRAIRLWQHCIKTDMWPGYAPAIHRVGAEQFQLARRLDREIWDDEQERFAIRSQQPLED